ncbi:hypothetical protein SAMN05661080_05141 [Modestobacter sp. DSM 44400]|uniref:hypothetical protein n=1 Tax=Modestobacter sp. DSM 44400 TaxID=1550230 RepID=UPI00089A0594|nr:hypothetical protein [Modestobacter sp. DSM 44400]SDY96050.1 hypothetical protein SAMN05661080_05141 [Modestobacter sp. DSM 44400]
MTAIDHSQRAARVVTEMHDRIAPEPSTQPAGPLFLEDFLGLASNLRDAGLSGGEEMQRIEDINAAIERMLAAQPGSPLQGMDLMTADPDEIAQRIRQAGIDRAAQMETVNVRNGFQHTLAKSAAAHLRADSDRVVREMRKRFDPAVKFVQAAAKRGLTEHSDMTVLLDMGAPDVIAAYRALGPAVAELDRLAALRNQLTTVVGVGPREHPMAAFITGVTTEAELEGAQNVWIGQLETVQHVTPMNGTHLANVRRNRLGGAWLALVCAGYTLRLNTGSEAQAVVDNAN